MEIFFRELLTKISKAMYSLENRLETLGTFGTIIQNVIGILLFLAIYILPILIISSLLPNFYKFGDQRSIDIVLTLLACLIFGFIYWLLSSNPKDYVASKITKDIHDTLSELNKYLDEASKLGRKINIEKDTSQDCLHISAHIKENSIKKSEDISDIKRGFSGLIDELNAQLKKANKRNLKVSLDVEFCGTEDLNEMGSSQVCQYRLFANISPN